MATTNQSTTQPSMATIIGTVVGVIAGIAMTLLTSTDDARIKGKKIKRSAATKKNKLLKQASHQKTNAKRKVSRASNRTKVAARPTTGRRAASAMG
jgi:hypothetical protein